MRVSTARLCSSCPFAWRAVSTRLSTPLLVTDRGVRYHDSRSILEYADATFGTPATSLLPVPEALGLDKHYHDKLGTHTRRVAYYHLLQDPGLLFDICKENVGDRQTAVFKASWPLMKCACHPANQAPRLAPGDGGRALRSCARLLPMPVRRTTCCWNFLLACVIAMACSCARQAGPLQGEGGQELRLHSEGV